MNDTHTAGVSADTPVIIRYNNNILICSVCNLPTHTNWDSNEEKQVVLPSHGLKVWSGSEFTSVKRITRHRLQNRLVQVNTNSGMVTLSENCNLLRDNRQTIQPSEICLEKDLLFTANVPSLMQSNEQNIDDELGWVVGLYFITGIFHSTGDLWLHDKKENILQAKKILERRYPKVRFYVSKEDDFIGLLYLCVDTNDVPSINFRAEWFEMFHNDYDSRIIPNFIWNASTSTQHRFLSGCKSSMSFEYTHTFTFRTQIVASSIYVLATCLGYQVELDYGFKDFISYFAVKIISMPKEINAVTTLSSFVKSIQNYSYWFMDQKYRYSYSLDTECNHFCAGIGKLVVRT